MSKICDHTSVGMLVEKEGKILFIERRNKPFGFAMPAGHVDGDVTYEIAAERELREEVGLIATKLELVAEGRKENPCKREGGTWHYWKVYKVSVEGELERSQEETKKVFWASRDEIKKLALRTEEYRAGKISEEEWEKNPSLEPIRYDWFHELGII